MKSISVFEIIKIGIGPSSSHTMGPWNAAHLFIDSLEKKNLINEIYKIKVDLYGSLAKTGKGHGTDLAVLMGLIGEDFITTDTSAIYDKYNQIIDQKKLFFANKYFIDFNYEKDLIFHFNETLPFHPNGMSFTAYTKQGNFVCEKFYSVGGGFISKENENSIKDNSIVTPYPCNKAEDIINNCKKLNLSFSELVMLNEQAWRSKEEIKQQALNIWNNIKDCIFRGISKEGILPGGLGVRRRANGINKHLLKDKNYTNISEWMKLICESETNFISINKWVSCFAMAVNEENASFGRIITAPTNGASGVIPAVLMYAYLFSEIKNNDKSIIDFILIAGEIGTLFKKNATISAAMGGCQAEIGVSSAMAAGALCGILGGNTEQALMAAEIAMEHHLGLTCDPINGLVQIPCIERNSMGAIKAITAAYIALESNPKNSVVSLDDVIKSMWQTSLDMNAKYKETSEGGLAVSISASNAQC